ncbi:hypothetical protein LTR66_013401 [Elasticomyces elasticus]|nr:hypothetical protein LTR66_013401 [Elasticomyces elasticus]
MITKYGYKQCPKCGYAVERRSGCPRMVCVCGAKWCYHCGKPHMKCYCRDDLTPESGDESDESEESDDQIMTSHELQARQPQASVSLDAGSHRPWARNLFDLGEELHDALAGEVLECKSHDYVRAKCTPITVCCKCFAAVVADSVPTDGDQDTDGRFITNRKLDGTASQAFQSAEKTKLGNSSSPAWECRKCSIVVCGACEIRSRPSASETESLTATTTSKPLPERQRQVTAARLKRANTPPSPKEASETESLTAVEEHERSQRSRKRQRQSFTTTSDLNNTTPSDKGQGGDKAANKH